jgi:DNA-binding transcriptional MocR family regulator
MVEISQLDSHSDVPLYRQLYDRIAESIKAGVLHNGERLPATRELAVQLGLNRTTVSAAYSLLEEEGLIRGHVGRGSFVNFESKPDELISFASSRPAEDHFPLAEFQETCREVIAGPEASAILQLGSPNGYAPLRQYLLEEARRSGEAGPEDDVLITNGCQQALDLLQRAMVSAGEAVAIEDPVYHGLKNVFTRGGARVLGVRMGEEGIDLEQLGRVLVKERPKALLVTSNFQNPTGATLPLDARSAVLKMARELGVMLVENNIYGDLRYEGEPLPAIKQLDGSGQTVLLRSFSKIAFPGLRVGWVIGPRPVIGRLAEVKQWCDLHTNQLSQAILLRFAVSGRLEAHARRVRADGAERLHAVLSACEKHLPAETRFTRPKGGMSLWVKLPEPLDASELLPRVEREKVTYLPGRYFSVSEYHPGTLRLSFGGMSPAQIESGVATLGRVFTEELARVRRTNLFEAAPAMV